MEQQAKQVLSLRLSRVLEDIGVNRYMIARRRRTRLMMETRMTISATLRGKNTKLYHFGSQSEGTTTVGMQSDIDTLFCSGFPVILDWDEWQQRKNQLLVVKTDQFPPQHCWLQWLRPDDPLPETQVTIPSDVIDNEGRVLYTNSLVEYQDIIRQFSSSGELLQHGPSRSWNEDDLVLGHHCCSLPKECQFLFHRPRPGHWPRPDTLARSRQTGVFLVPQGYSECPSRPTRCRSTALHVTPNNPYYPQSNWEWRFSTSMMERLLMFDMNTVQYKTYVFIKILRKTFIKPLVGDRLSTFHMKTAMLFTIETYPPEIWREENLVQCVIYCLTTLCRWLKLKHCPHYTIDRVNLLTGKLFKHELPILSAMLSSLMESNMPYIPQIDMDLLGVKMLAISRSLVPGSNERKKNNQLILFHLNREYNDTLVIWGELVITNFSMYTWDELNALIIEYLHTLQQISQNGTDLEQESATMIMPLLYSSFAPLIASMCIHIGQSITQDILHLYHLSFDTDLLSSRLKFASMLYCNGQYDAAENCLVYCEGLLGPEVWQSCSCVGRICIEPSSKFLDKTEHSSNKDILQKFTAICVCFMPQEMCCVPEHLLYEMFRTVGDEDRQQRHPARYYKWMDQVVIDCIPFLYYLQYLTYRQLHMHHRKHAAQGKLSHYILRDSHRHGHIDTALNMLGNCYELENRLDVAWKCYSTSLEIYQRNNAANWHVARILHQLVNS
ncbi:uncharacterized protein LOC128243759 [Mya arenaria]|uniref:uncharacterized protein LOC128243759 n=1 Tax=Mya arenaria TaxID=6604 RepID=UPI0022E6AC56|nr:uncharacterized protein LOC128243759 [Mya arenaria]XP_052817647.1 uncharacterized protein LOC128243759 [Mya arenaria]XP_052817648.1 uncharacterized protein LOC128243759 [Mya arenaria]